MLTVLLVLALTAFVCTILHAIGKCPVWVPLIILSLYCLLQQLPLGR